LPQKNALDAGRFFWLPRRREPQRASGADQDKPSREQEFFFVAIADAN